MSYIAYAPIDSGLTRFAHAQSGNPRSNLQTRRPSAPGIEVAQAEQPPATAPANTTGSSGKSREILDAAADKLKGYSSIRANITQKVNLPPHSYTAKGSYVQGQDLQLRMEFTVELGAIKASLLEVCDGQVLWSRQDLGEKDQTQITRRDVRQILQAAQQQEQSLKNPDEKQMRQAVLQADLGIGGLPALMAALIKDFEFKPATEDKIDDRAVTVIEGTWTPRYREMWLGQKARDKNPPALRPHIPESVRISLDQETQFPRRIEYFRKFGGQSTPTAIYVFDFTKVSFNGKVNRDDFIFIPPDRPAHVDITQMYLQQLAPPKKEAAPAKKAAE